MVDWYIVIEKDEFMAVCDINFDKTFNQYYVCSKYTIKKYTNQQTSSVAGTTSYIWFDESVEYKMLSL